jgi:hypothetical protein
MSSSSPLSHPVPVLLSPATASARFVGNTTAGLKEVWLYLSGSRQSRLWQLASLRDLDERLRRDVGLAPRVPPRADAWPGQGW